MKKLFLTFAACLLWSSIAFGQAEKFVSSVTIQRQRAIVEHLCDSLLEGRAAGTKGGQLAGDYIQAQFDSLQLRPFYYNRKQTFWNKGKTMHNVLGVVPALAPSDKYVVVSAHYDHIGILKGKFYPGADDNAAGVAALISVAEMFSQMRRDSIGPGVNIIFAAFDAKQLSMAGSKHFIASLPFSPGQILCEINLDIFGSSLVPVRSRKDYLIVLGRHTLPENLRSALTMAGSKAGLDIDYTFYGSDDFTKTMFKIGDQYSFSQKGIPALMMTSGFHSHTLKTSDTPEIIDWEVLLARTRYLFYTTLYLSNGGNR